MGNRSDKNYDGWVGRGDWDENKKPKKTTETPLSYEEKQAMRAAQLANEASEEIKKIIRTQLPLFKFDRGVYVRTVGNEAFKTLGHQSRDHTYLFTLFTDAGLRLEDIGCQSGYGDQSHPNLDVLITAIESDRQKETKRNVEE